MDYAKNMSTNVKALIEAKGVSSIRQFALSIGISPSTFNDSLKSKKGFPVDLAIRVADALGFSVEDLTQKTPVELLKKEFSSSRADLPEEMQTVLFIYNQMNDEGREELVNYVKYLSSQDKYKKDNSSFVVEGAQ